MSSNLAAKIDSNIGREAYTVEEFAEMFGISRSTTYALFRKGTVRPSRILGRTVITKAEKDRFAASLHDEVA